VESALLVFPSSFIRCGDAIPLHYDFAALEPLKHLDLMLSSRYFPTRVLLGEQEATITKITGTRENKRYVVFAQPSLANAFRRMC
jgi:hypothetical protein